MSDQEKCSRETPAPPTDVRCAVPRIEEYLDQFYAPLVDRMPLPAGGSPAGSAGSGTEDRASRGDTEARWRICLLGGLHAERCGRVLTRFRTQKTGVLLAYLAYHRDCAHLRLDLVELLWPEADLEAGRQSLASALSSLRGALERDGAPAGSVIVADRRSVRLRPGAVTTDVAAFEAALKTAERTATPTERTASLVQAIGGYGGELLPGSYDGWILQEREWLAERYFQALAHVLAHLEHAREFPRALEYARRGVRADPLREEAHRALMRLLAAVGQPGAALRQYRQLERLLEQELEAQPSAATQALAQQLAVLANKMEASELLTPSHGYRGWQCPHGAVR